MKKIILSLIALCFFIVGVQAQSLKMLYDGVDLGDTLRLNISDYTPGETRDYHINFRNDGQDDSVTVTFSQTTLRAPNQNSILEWCGPNAPDIIFANCYSEDGTSESFVIRGHQASETDFKISYTPDNAHDPVDVRYTLRNVNNESDVVSVIVLFRDPVVKINNNTAKIEANIEVFPNPVSKNLGVRYSFSKPQKEASFVIRNMVGVIVKDISIKDTQGKLEINVETLPNGVYFYSLILNGQVSTTKKLIVKH